MRPCLGLPRSHPLLNSHQPTSPGSLAKIAVAIPDKLRRLNVRIGHLFRRSITPLVFACALATVANAQSSETPSPVPTPTTSVIMPEIKSAPAVAGYTDVYCAGFIQYVPAPIHPEIVGGEQEQERRSYSEGNYVFVNAGAQQGMKVGQEFQIVRPRGAMSSKFTSKHGWLGVYMQELGRLRLINVKDKVSVAQITQSCDTILLGDLLREVNNRVSPTQRAEANLDRFAEPTGKQRGRIVMATSGREMVTTRHIVYIDLGAEDNVKAGDYLTIYRPVGTGNLTRVENEEIARARSAGFESERYAGGKFSGQAQRTKDYSSAPGLFFRNETMTTHEIKRRRPAVPRKVVGELVILTVQTRTATAVITRVAQEVHTGDFVELQ